MIYLYRNSLGEAKRNGMEKYWAESKKENIKCKNAIESAISESFNGERLDDAETKRVIANFGYDRTMWVLAASVCNKYDDGRFSRENKEWARSIFPNSIPNNETWEYCVDSHPAVLNGFIVQVQKEYEALGLVGKKQCIKSDEEQEYVGKLLILKPECLNEQYKNPINQYFYATGGFGCYPDKLGGKVFGFFLSDGEKTHFYRNNFVGAADREQLPKWAAERLEQIEAPRMQIRVFQIDHDKDSKNLAFMDYGFTRKHGGVDGSIYRQVYGGTVECSDLEGVFSVCNADRKPLGYYGESMSVSNVIEVCDGKYKGFYFCDRVGFESISFDIEKTDHNDMMKILILENGKAPYTAEIRQDIHAMQSAVDGYIEPIYFEPKDDAIVWCNEEFLLRGFVPNRMVGQTLVHGPFFISGNAVNADGEWDSCSLTDKQIEKYTEMFRYPVILLEQTQPQNEIEDQSENNEITIS